jgi:hypothetical protein
MPASNHEPRRGQHYLSESVVTAMAAECKRIDSDLGHVVWGRYLGNRDGHPNVSSQTRGRTGTHGGPEGFRRRALVRVAGGGSSVRRGVGAGVRVGVRVGGVGGRVGVRVRRSGVW